MLAYCLEHTEGIGFSKGLSDPGEPAIFVRDLTGVLMAWIDIGLPEPERLHRASKAAPRVAVYTHKDPSQWAVKVDGAKIHRAEKLEVFAFDRTWLSRIVSRLERRMQFSLARSEGEIYLTLGGETSQTVLGLPLAGPRPRLTNIPRSGQRAARAHPGLFSKPDFADCNAPASLVRRAAEPAFGGFMRSITCAKSPSLFATFS